MTDTKVSFDLVQIASDTVPALVDGYIASYDSIHSCDANEGTHDCHSDEYVACDDHCESTQPKQHRCVPINYNICPRIGNNKPLAIVNNKISLSGVGAPSCNGTVYQGLVLRCIYNVGDFQTGADLTTYDNYFGPKAYWVTSLPNQTALNNVAATNGVSLNNIKARFCQQPSSAVCTIKDPSSGKASYLCSRPFSSDAQETNFCKDFLGQNNSTSDAAMQAYCNSHPTSPDCKCLLRGSDPDFQSLTEAVWGQGYDVSKSPPACWYAPCQDSSSYLISSDVKLDNSSQVCPDVCQQIIEAADDGKIDISNSTITQSCKSENTDPKKKETRAVWEWLVLALVSIVVVVWVVWLVRRK